MGWKEEHWRGDTEHAVEEADKRRQDDRLPLPLPLGVRKEPLPLPRLGPGDFEGAMGALNLTFFAEGRDGAGGAGLLRLSLCLREAE